MNQLLKLNMYILKIHKKDVTIGNTFVCKLMKVEDHSLFPIHLSYSFEGYRKIHEYRRIKKTLFSTHTTLVPLVKKVSTHVNHENISEKWNFGAYPYKANFEDF